MSSNMTMGTAKFERMTKEEKLRFCQDLIRQAVNLSKPSSISGARSTGSKSTMSGGRLKSKSSKRPASVSGTISKKTKNGTLTHNGRSKSTVKSSASLPVCHSTFSFF